MHFERGGFFDHTFIDTLCTNFACIELEYQEILSPIGLIYEMNIPLFIDKDSNFFICHTTNLPNVNNEVIKIAMNKYEFFEYIFNDRYIKYIYQKYEEHKIREFQNTMPSRSTKKPKDTILRLILNLAKLLHKQSRF
jgi:hypothetical protein